MKISIIVVIIALFLLIKVVTAAVESYVVDAIIFSERVSVKLAISFPPETKNFKFFLPIRIDNFNATTTAGPAQCEVKINGITDIDCWFNLTFERRTLMINFDTSDFLKKVDERVMFIGDFSLNENIEKLYVTLRLDEGLVLTKDQEIFPKNGVVSSDGRRIIVLWRDENVSSEETLKYQLTSEPLITQPVHIIQPWQFIIIATIAALLSTYFVLKSWKKPEKIIFSMLDDFERKVMNVIITSGGKVNQRRVVQQTGLSKAKVSRVVKSLANKKLITVERRGRTNILRIVKKKFGF
ncbi:MAG: hypothetical protein QMD14_02615 [Candidatus Aenigmarchaeota archaeon]|nr:hypothetical protein [Candidatus Aenigmarchaeota archaeon]